MIEMLWAYKTIWIWISILSLFLFLFSLGAVPWLVARIPHTYFKDLARAGKKEKAIGGSRVARAAVRGLKNGLGVVLVVAGIVMLFVPGQGLLTILAGLVLLEFPGKRRLLLILVGYRQVQDGLNWIRRKKRRPPLVFSDPRNG